MKKIKTPNKTTVSEDYRAALEDFKVKEVVDILQDLLASDAIIFYSKDKRVKEYLNSVNDKLNLL